MRNSSTLGNFGRVPDVELLSSTHFSEKRCFTWGRKNNTQKSSQASSFISRAYNASVTFCSQDSASSDEGCKQEQRSLSVVAVVSRSWIPFR